MQSTLIHNYNDFPMSAYSLETQKTIFVRVSDFYFVLSEIKAAKGDRSLQYSFMLSDHVI